MSPEERVSCCSLFPETLCLEMSQWPPQGSPRAPLSHTKQHLISLKLHILVVCPSCCSARNWCSLQSQDYLKENQEGFKLQVSCWWLQAGLFEFCFASTANKQFGARRGENWKKSSFPPPQLSQLGWGMVPSSSAAGWKRSRKPQQLSSSHRMGMFSIHNRSNLWDASFLCQRFPFLVLGQIPDHCTLAAGPWHSSGKERLGGQGLLEVKKQTNKKPSDCSGKLSHQRGAVYRRSL